MRWGGGGGGGGDSGPNPPPPEKSGFLSDTGLDSMKNHKASKPVFYVGPSSARQRNTI